jgi:hypothetical protein
VGDWSSDVCSSDLPRFLHSIQECIRKTFLTSDAHVRNGAIAIGLTTPIPFVRELMHDSASLRVMHKDGSCSL